MSSVVNTQPVGTTPNGYQQLTVSTVALALTVPVGTVRAVVQCATEGVRFRNDGVDPTSSVGFLLAAGVVIDLYGNVNLKAVKLIRSGSNDASVNVIYYKE